MGHLFYSTVALDSITHQIKKSGLAKAKPLKFNKDLIMQRSYKELQQHLLREQE